MVEGKEKERRREVVNSREEERSRREGERGRQRGREIGIT